MVRIKNRQGQYICLAWASKDASKAFGFTEKLAAQAMFSIGVGNCIIEPIDDTQRMTPAQEHAYDKGADNGADIIKEAN